jgi:hypothetical protein
MATQSYAATRDIDVAASVDATKVKQTNPVASSITFIG